jgi:hypothetical protein
MLSNHFTDSPHPPGRKNTMRWLAVALYTAALPFVIIAFRAIEQHFPPQTAGRIPLLIVGVLAAGYSLIRIKQKAAVQCIAILAAGALLVLGIVKFEDNANKYIHIPEYIIMTWLLYLALIVDYKGKGILLLGFFCALMLGIVDEILQGIHPQRTYGGKDMLIDAASSLIGILSLLRLDAQPQKTWTWLKNLKHFKGALGFLLIGAAAAVFMGVCLFDVQAQGNFFSAYPQWLLAVNCGFIGACIAVIIFHWRRRSKYMTASLETDQIALNNHTTAMLWIICPLVMLLAMHALVVWVAVSGINFR